MPTPIAVALTFGRNSLAFGRTHAELRRLWAAIGDHPEVRLKRDLWDGLLRQVYGDDVGSDALFLQHTYLTILVKAIAARVLDLSVDDPAAVLSGRLLADEGILGAVEADFFDWPLLAAGGEALVRELAAETVRFRLRDVEVDVLKSHYESLIDPDERHDLGEYYTPDWLAARVVATAISRPLEKRVLDPSCGSGTFLFHALRRLIRAGRGRSTAQDRGRMPLLSKHAPRRCLDRLSRPSCPGKWSASHAAIVWSQHHQPRVCRTAKTDLCRAGQVSGRLEHALVPAEPHGPRRQLPMRKVDQVGPVRVWTG
jgi:hypothetical protein